MDDFTKAGVIGLAAISSPPANDPDLDPLFIGDERSRERQFLLRAGARAVFQIAGRATAHSGSSDKAAKEDWTVCAPGTAASLQDALALNDEGLCVEMAALMTEARRRAPFALIPALLSLRSKAARAAVVPIVGKRGHWLASHRDEWRWLTSSVPSEGSIEQGRELWDSGAIEVRMQVLRQMRSSEPETARDWLAAVWKEESAENRAAFLQLFSTDLNAGDEEFLDKALTDRSMAVRAVAASLLALLPASRFAGRCLARALDVIRFESKSSVGFASIVKTLAGKDSHSLKLICDPPTAEDPIAKEIVAGRTPPGVGARAYLLSQLLSLVDVNVWEEQTEATPEEILRAAGETDWMAPLISGFARSALLHRRSAWFLPLLRVAALSQELLREEWIEEVAKSLPHEEAERFVLDLLDRRYPLLTGRTEAVFSALPSSWRPEFSRNLILALRRLFERGGDSDETMLWTALLPRVSRSIDRAAFADALAEWKLGETFYGPSRTRQVDELQQIVRLRKRFQEELTRD